MHISKTGFPIEGTDQATKFDHQRWVDILLIVRITRDGGYVEIASV